MPLFLITGLPGSGKSTLCAELKTRGYEAYDGDEDGLAKWYNEHGRPIKEVGYRDRSPEFLRQHSRDISRKAVEGLAAKAHNKPIFLCADPENEVELNDLFEEIFALVLNDASRNHRLLTRTNNNWGKLPHERQYSIAYGKKWQKIRQRFGYTAIDATQSTERMADQILAKIGT